MHMHCIILILISGMAMFHAAASEAPSSPKPLVLTFFGSAACDQCEEIKTQLLQPLEAAHAQKLKINYRNLDDTNDLNLCTAMEKGYNLTETASQELFFPDTALRGYDAIMSGGKSLIESYLDHPEKGVYRHAFGDTTIDTVSPDQIIRQRKLLDSVCSAFIVKPCTGISIAEECKKEKPCDAAVRLREFAGWLVFKGKTYDECMKDLDDRVNCLTSTKTFALNETKAPLAGDKQAPVTVVVYMSATCPLCKFLVSDLYGEVTAGSLRGKANLLAKPYTQTIGDFALVAAARYGRFWDFARALNVRKERPDSRMILAIVDSLKMPDSGFRQTMKDTTLTTELERNHDEAVKNEVTVSPTVFINNKRYRSYKDPRWVVDAVLWELKK